MKQFIRMKSFSLMSVYNSLALKKYKRNWWLSYASDTKVQFID